MTGSHAGDRTRERPPVDARQSFGYTKSNIMTTEQKAQRNARIHRLFTQGEPLTKAEIARVMGISQVQVDRILNDERVKGNDNGIAKGIDNATAR